MLGNVYLVRIGDILHLFKSSISFLILLIIINYSIKKHFKLIKNNTVFLKVRTK